MRFLRALTILTAFLAPAAAIAAPILDASCCDGGGPCCPKCPRCPNAR